MTREEAIKILVKLREYYCKHGIFEAEALDMAIKALSQEPCDDAISRDAVIEATHHCGDLQEVRAVVQQLPSVTQKSGKWISVSERLPEEEIDVLVCNSNGEIEISAGSYSTEANDFMWYTSGWKFGRVTAWMPLPHPYEPQEKRCADCNHYGKLSLDCGRCDDDCSMYEPQESEDKE